MLGGLFVNAAAQTYFAFREKKFEAFPCAGMRNCVIFTFLIIAQIVKGGRGRRRVGAGRLSLAGGHVVREERCNSTRSQDYSRPWVTSLYRYKFQTISSMSVLSGGGFSVLQTEFAHRLQRRGTWGDPEAQAGQQGLTPA